MSFVNNESVFLFEINNANLCFVPNWEMFLPFSLVKRGLSPYWRTGLSTQCTLMSPSAAYGGNKQSVCVMPSLKRIDVIGKSAENFPMPVYLALPSGTWSRKWDV